MGRLCLIVLALCIITANSAPVPPQTEEWTNDGCTFPPKTIMDHVSTSCQDPSKNETIGGKTLAFTTSVCDKLLQISVLTCQVPADSLQTRNASEEDLLKVMENGDVDACEKAAGLNESGELPQELQFMVDDLSTCRFLTEDDPATTKLIRLLVHLAQIKQKLPPSPEHVWKTKFQSFEKFWSENNCTFPPQSFVDGNLKDVCFKPPKPETPNSKAWIFQEKLCEAVYDITNKTMACTNPQLKAERLNTVLGAGDLDVCAKANDLSSFLSAGKQLNVLVDMPAMCSHMCKDLVHVVPVCKTLLFAVTVPLYEKFSRLMPKELTDEEGRSEEEDRQSDETGLPSDSVDIDDEDYSQTPTVETLMDGNNQEEPIPISKDNQTQPDGNKKTSTDAGSNGYSMRVMLFIIIAISLIVLLYCLYFQRKRLTAYLPCCGASGKADGEREAGEGPRYSLLKTADEPDVLSLPRDAVQKAKRYIY